MKKLVNLLNVLNAGAAGLVGATDTVTDNPKAKIGILLLNVLFAKFLPSAFGIGHRIFYKNDPETGVSIGVTKKLLIVPLALALSAAPAMAHGASQVELLYSGVVPSDELSDVEDYEGAFGGAWVYHTKGPWKVEVRGLWSDSEQIRTTETEVAGVDSFALGGPVTVTTIETVEGSVFSMSVGFRLHFLYDKPIQPYLAAGGGPTVTEHGEDFVTWNAGAGLIFDCSDFVDLVVEGRYSNPIDKEHDVHAIAATVGLSLGR